MISVVVVTHLDVAPHLIQAAERVVGKQKNLFGINFHMDETFKSMTERVCGVISECSQSTDRPSPEILILTDLFGSTPTNASCSQIQASPCSVQILTGVNLPMLISSLTYRDQLSLPELAQKALTDARKGIRCIEFLTK